MEFSAEAIACAVDHATKKAGLSELKVEQRKVLHQFVCFRGTTNWLWQVVLLRFVARSVRPPPFEQ